MGKDLNGKDLGKGITQRKDDRYMYRYTDIFGKKCTRYADTEREIKKIKRDIEYELEHNIYTDTAKITLNSWYEFWIDKKRKERKSKTAKNYSYYYNIYIRDTIGMLYMSDITSVMCQEVLNGLLDKGIAHSSIRMVKIVIGALYNEALQFGKCVSSPITKNMFCGEVEDNQEKKALTQSEEEEFLKYAEKTLFYNLYVVAFETGLRIGELCSLSVDCIDLTKNVLYVKRTFNFDKEECEPYYSKPKTKKSIRVVPLTSKAQVAIRRQMMRSQSLPSSKKEFDDLLFRNKKGNPFNHREVNRACKRITNNINSDREINSIENGKDFCEFPNMHIHMTRHTFATKCVRKGLKPEYLQVIMGHSRISTTLSYYVHLNEDDLIKAMSEMEEKSSKSVSKVCQKNFSNLKIG